MADAFGYGRRSDDDQSAFSPDAQKRAFYDWCAANGHRPVQWYFDDDLSGKRDDRDNFQRLLDDACAHPGSLVVVHKIDRLARDTELILNRHKKLKKHRVKLVSITEPVDFDTPFGTVILTQIASLGQFHVDNLAPEVIKGLYEKYEQGGHNGPVPYGAARRHQFDAKGERIKGTEEIIKTDDAPTVELIFQLYATGCYSDATLRDELHRRGLTFLDLKTGARVPFQRDTVGLMLTNPFYIGMVSYKGVLREGKHEPFISRDVWDAVQAIRQRRTTHRRGRYPQPTETGLFSEIGYCGICGALLYYHKNSTNGISYYWCRNRRKYGSLACDTRMMHAVKHESLIIDVLRALILPPQLVEATLEEVERQLAQLPRPAATIDRASVQRQLDRLRAAYFGGDEAISDAMYRSESARLKGLLAESSPQLARQLNHEKARAMMQTIGAVLDAANGQERRAVVQQLFDRVWLERGRITAVRPTGTYVALVEAAAKVNMAISTGLEPATFSSGG